MNNKLIIGTANFGLKYGIANPSQISPAEIDRILTLAAKSGVWGIDTAKGYGDAEMVLGNYIKVNRPVFKIITKLTLQTYTFDELQAQVQDSLNKLHVSQLDYVLLHSFITYSKYRDKIVAGFTRLQRTGKIKNWGVSLYHPSEVEQLVADGLSNIAIEFPLNLFDRRFLKDNLLERLKLKNYQLFVRSVFLQGLFFLTKDRLSRHFKNGIKKIEALNELSRVTHMKVSDIALLFVLNQKLIDGVIIGVDSPKQLLGNLESLSQRAKYQQIENQLEILEVVDKKIILPYLWPVQNPTKN